MIVDECVEVVNKESNQNVENSPTKNNFLQKLVWKESSYGKWYLGNRECQPADGGETHDPEIITFDMGGFEESVENDTKVNVDDPVISEMGKYLVTKIEENQVFLKMDPDEVPVPLDTVKKVININYIILGKTKNYILEKNPINICHSVSTLKSKIAEYLTITPEMISLSFKEKVLSDDTYIHNLEIAEGDSFLIGFNQNELSIYKRSTSRDYSWYDQKNFIPFIVDKTIIVSAFGFFKHTDTAQAIYDFFLYEKKDDGSKLLILQMLNVKVLPTECDSEMYVKKVTCTPTILKENVNYHVYVNYKISDMRTYFAYYGTADQTVNGVRFRMLDGNESGYRSSSTSGHMPYIYFKLYNPYDD